MINKKRRFILSMVILSCLLILVPITQAFAEDNGGGNVTTPGKVTFEVEKTEDSTTTSTTKPPKPKPKPKITGKKFLPKTGENNSISLSVLGAILIFCVGAGSYLHRSRGNKGGEQL